jgi:hypothetical protein
MKLYHLTSIYHLPLILSAGYLKVVESNISLMPREEHKGPDVVWLTTSPRAGQGWARMRPQLAYVDKTRIVFEVEVPDDDVHNWYDWAQAHGSTLHFMKALAASGDERHHQTVRVGSDVEADEAALERARAEWFVVEREVPWVEWLRINDQLAGTLIWQRTEDQLSRAELDVPALFATPDAGRLHSGTLMARPMPVTVASQEAWLRDVTGRELG